MRAAAPFVLVHGAWQSAATWDLIAPRLRERGYRVYAARLTGLGPDAGPLTSAVTLRTHIQDVVELVRQEDLDEVVLVGHSYAGMVITGVAEHARDRLRHLVYVDAFVADHGQSALALLPAPIREAFRAQAEAEGGWRLPAGERQLDLWGLEPGPARDFVRARLCDFTINAFAAPVEAPAGSATTLDRTYVACVRDGYPARAVFAPFANRAREEGWRYHELPTGHDCHVEAPDAVADILSATVESGSDAARPPDPQMQEPTRVDGRAPS